MLLVLVTFIMGVVFLGFVNKAHGAASIPSDSLAVFNKLAKELSGTAIPEYVLEYGTATQRHVSMEQC